MCMYSVCACLCECVCVCMCVSVCVYVCVHVCIDVYIYTCLSVCTFRDLTHDPSIQRTKANKITCTAQF